MLTVVVSCGNYASDELPLDLRFEQFAPLLVTMRPSHQWCEQVNAIRLRAPNACTSCHDEGGAGPGAELSTSFVIGEDGVVQGAILLDLGQAQIGSPSLKRIGESSEDADER